MPLYKYMRAEHADALLRLGQIRVGTLYQYRASTDERVDGAEGSTQYVMPGSKIDMSLPSVEADYLKSLGIHSGSIENKHPTAALVISEKLHPDCYIYCASQQFNAALLAKFGGACVELEDPGAFFDAIDGSLKNAGHVVGPYQLAPIAYCPAEKVHSFTKDGGQALPGWMVKPAVFSPEAEVRAMWRSTTETDLESAVVKSLYYKARTLKPLTIGVPTLVGHASLRRLQ